MHRTSFHSRPGNFSPSAIHAHSHPLRGTRGGGGWNPLPDFLMCCCISKRFCLQSKTFDLLNKIRYISRVVALLQARDATNSGRHLYRHLGFYQELEISQP